MSPPNNVKRFEFYSVLALLVFLIVSRIFWESNTPARIKVGPEYLSFFKFYIPFASITIICARLRNKLSQYIYLAVFIYFMGSYFLDFVTTIFNYFQLGMIFLVVPYLIFYFAIKNLFSVEANLWFESGEDDFYKLSHQFKQLSFQIIRVEVIKFIKFGFEDLKTVINLIKKKNKTLFNTSLFLILILIVGFSFSQISKPLDFNSNEIFEVLKDDASDSAYASCELNNFIALEDVSLKNGSILGLDLFSNHLGLVAFKKDCRISDKKISRVFVNIYDKNDSENFLKNSWTQSILVREYDHINSFNTVAVRELYSKNNKIYLRLFEVENENESLIEVPFIIRLGSDGLGEIVKDDVDGVKIISSIQKESDMAKLLKKQKIARQNAINRKINLIKNFEALYSPQVFFENLFHHQHTNIYCEDVYGGCKPFLKNISCENFTLLNVKGFDHKESYLVIPVNEIDKFCHKVDLNGSPRPMGEGIQPGEYVCEDDDKKLEYAIDRNSKFPGEDFTVDLNCKGDINCVNQFDNGKKTYLPGIDFTFRLFADARNDYFQIINKNESYYDDINNLKSLSFEMQIHLLASEGVLLKVINNQFKSFLKSCS